MKNLNISRLQSGGLITTYRCTSRCRHCLYACSPRWSRHYMDPKTAAENLRIMKSLGCSSLHIGGGEPFTDIAALEAVMRVAAAEQVAVEYIETNSSWFRGEESAVEILHSLKAYGLDMLLVSISPYHNEFIPFRHVKGVISACRKAGLSVYPWVQGFYADLDALEDGRPHSLEEYGTHFGQDYPDRIPQRYWIHPGGRALSLGRHHPSLSLERIVNTPYGCSELADTTHFHPYPFGNYIPALCSGLAIRASDLRRPLREQEYPIINTLYREGMGGLLKIASEEYGFRADEEYASKCHLCLQIRQFLVLEKGMVSRELQPGEFYRNL